MSQSKIILSILIIFCGFAKFGFAQTTEPYSLYENTPHHVNELEWNLLKINIQMSKEEVYVKFDKTLRRFLAEGWVLTSTVDIAPVLLLEKNLLSKVERLKALIVLYIREFDDRGQHDILVEFYLGTQGGPVIAVYRNNKLIFTEEFYEYLRKSGALTHS